MTGSQKFFICEKCGNMIVYMIQKGPPVVCCGAEMSELVANTVDASVEKHLPDITVNGNELHVQVGSVLHPLEEGHHITFIYVATERGGQRKPLAIGDEPKASFCFIDDKPVAVYAYCNLHGLWKTAVS